MSARQVCHSLSLDDERGYSNFEVYTYDTLQRKVVPFESMGETVHLDLTVQHGRFCVPLTPEQARRLSLYLASVADACDANRARHQAAAQSKQPSPEVTS